jgi:hypothetical protein
MAEGSSSGQEISDLPYGTRNFLAFAKTSADALQLLRKGTLEGTSLMVSGDDIKSIFGITQHPKMAVVNDKHGGAAFHRKGPLGIETKANTTYEAVQALSEEAFQLALVKAKATEQSRPRP